MIGVDGNRLSFLRLAMFASPAAPLSALTLPLLLFLPPFYANEMGLGLAVVGFVFGITRLFDVVTDLAAGVLVDRFPTRWGRRKPWLVLALPFLLVSIYFLFFPEKGVGQGYLWFWMLVMYIGFTLANIAHYAWAAELSADYNERSRIMAMIQFMQAIGLLAIILVPAVLTAMGRPVAPAAMLSIMGGAILVLYPLSTVLACSSTGEKPGKAATIRWRDAVDLVRLNPPLRKLIVVDFFNTFIAGAMSGSLLFYLASVIGKPDAAPFGILAGLGSSIPTYILWPFLARRWGKHRASVAVALVGVVGVTALALAPAGSLPTFLIGWSLFSIATNGFLLLLKSIMADIVDYDHVQSGSERSGLMFAILTMVNKLGLAASQAITYPVLHYFGFQPGSTTNDATAMAALYGVFVGVPALLFIAMAALIWRFPLTEAKQKELRAILDQRKAAKGAAAD